MEFNHCSASIRTMPYTTLASVPKVMTGPASSPQSPPRCASACVKSSARFLASPLPGANAPLVCVGVPHNTVSGPYYPASIRTMPYTTLASVPKVMTGPATVNILAAMPVTKPSGCVKIDIQFFRNFFSCLQSGPLIVLACRYKCKPARSTHIYLNLS